MWKSNMERTRNSWAGEICATNQGIKVTYYGHTGEDDVWEHYVLFDKKTGRILAYQSWSDTPVWEWPVVRKKGSKRKNAIAAYKSILSKETIKLNKYTNAKAEYIQFKLCDIDGNKVPELLLTYGGASTSDGFYHILGIVDGKVKSIKRSYMSGFNIYKNSYIEEGGAGRSPEGTSTWKYLYKFDGKKARMIAKEYIDELETGGVRKTYTIHGKNVSYKKYKTQLDKIKKGKEVSGNWNTYLKNTKRNRKQALR